MRGRILITVAACALPAFGQDATPGASEGPLVSENGVAISAGLATGGKSVAPGSLITIFGTSLAAALATADTVPLSNTLSDVSVTINGIAAPLSYVSPTRLTVQVPWGLQTGTAAVVVSRPTGVSPSANVEVTATAPAIFTVRAFDSRYLAVAQNADDNEMAWPVNAMPGTKSKPVKRGQTLIFFATGLGAVDMAPADGDAGGEHPGHVVATPTVTVGEVAAEVLSAGLSSGYVGVNEIRIVVPADAPTGNAVPLKISTADGQSAEQVLIAVE
jgi:uncharacterized protein (TIGR03437 family)